MYPQLDLQSVFTGAKSFTSWNIFLSYFRLKDDATVNGGRKARQSNARHAFIIARQQREFNIYPDRGTHAPTVELRLLLLFPNSSVSISERAPGLPAPPAPEHSNVHIQIFHISLLVGNSLIVTIGAVAVTLEPSAFDFTINSQLSHFG
jgi:hypothetical protein